MDCSFRYAATSGPPPRVSLITHVKVVLLALVGGVMGIVAAGLGEAQVAGGFLLVLFIGAPVIEEAFKPIGVYLAIARWPNAVRNQLHIAGLCALSGLVFGLIESAVYIWVYVPHHPDWFVYYRFLVNAPLHAVFSFVVGLGLSRATVDWLSRGAPFPVKTRKAYFAAVALHAWYNTTAAILAFNGVFDF